MGGSHRFFFYPPPLLFGDIYLPGEVFSKWGEVNFKGGEVSGGEVFFCGGEVKSNKLHDKWEVKSGESSER